MFCSMGLFVECVLPVTDGELGACSSFHLSLVQLSFGISCGILFCIKRYGVGGSSESGYAPRVLKFIL